MRKQIFIFIIKYQTSFTKSLWQSWVLLQGQNDMTRTEEIHLKPIAILSLTNSSHSKLIDIIITSKMLDIMCLSNLILKILALRWIICIEILHYFSELAIVFIVFTF